MDPLPVKQRLARRYLRNEVGVYAPATVIVQRYCTASMRGRPASAPPASRSTRSADLELQLSALSEYLLQHWSTR